MPSFIPRERKHKRIARVQKQTPLGALAPKNGDDGRAEQPVSLSKAERESRRRVLQDELKAQQAIKVSGKKRKRLEKYVDTKLRREANAELIGKLAGQRVDTSLLQSSKKLGRVGETKRERLARALAEQKAGVDVYGDHDEVLLQRRRQVMDHAKVNNGGGDEETDSESGGNEGETNGVELTSSAQPATQSFGAGLKRPLVLDGDGKPVIRKRKRRKVAKAAPLPRSVPEDEVSEEPESADDEHEEWAGLSIDDRLRETEELRSRSSSDEEALMSPNSDENEDEEDSSEGEEQSSTTSYSSAQPNACRLSAFKAWADQQRNTALGFTPSSTLTGTINYQSTANRAAPFKPRAPSPDALLHEPSPHMASDRPAVALTIQRSDDMQKARLELPVVQEEQQIMETIHANPVSILCGATGSGKTTQVPQMLLENGYGSAIGTPKSTGAPSVESQEDPRTRGMIAVTQPRRVAALSVAARVADELGPSMSGKVAHQVRYDSSSVTKDTAIKFMTDGILLREIQTDFILSKYSVVAIDEAHERTVNTDILISMLSRIVALRQQLSNEDSGKPGHYPLKMVIMSATLRINDFTSNTRLFRDGAPPIVRVEGRQYPVTVHFARKTPRDYVAEIVRKVGRGHRKLPAGGILVFLTGQNEILHAMKELRKALGASEGGYGGVELKTREWTKEMPLEAEDFGGDGGQDEFMDGESGEDEEEAEITGLDNDDAEDNEDFVVAESERLPGQRGHGVPLKAHILPLYASLPTREQMKVFQSPPPESRAIVLATNVAETSLTIPGVRYVFDCGRAKEKRYDPGTGVQTFEVGWISQASAMQREGRAGRTGPGHCYRVYSSAVYERDFAEFAMPEILRTPLEGVVLGLKEMDVDNVDNFPFPTPPESGQLAQAQRLLESLGALDKNGRITSVGREISRYPLSPRFGKILCLARANGVLGWAVAVVAALAGGEVFLPQNMDLHDRKRERDGDDSDSDDERQEKRMRTHEDNAAAAVAEERRRNHAQAHAMLSRWDDHSDAVKLLTLVAAAADQASSSEALRRFSEKFFVREKGLQEVLQLRSQLAAIVWSQHRHFSHERMGVEGVLKPPTEKQRAVLKQVVAAGFVDQVAIRADLLPSSSGGASSAAEGFGRKPRRATEVPYRTLFSSSGELDRAASPEVRERAKNVFIHPSSVLAHLSTKEMPAYVVYSHLSRAAPSSVTVTASDLPPMKTRMHPLTTLSAKQLAALAEGSPLLELGKPIGKVEMLGRDDRGCEGRVCWVGLTLTARRGDGEGETWPVGAWKVVQRRVTGGGWDVEKVVAR